MAPGWTVLFLWSCCRTASYYTTQTCFKHDPVSWHTIHIYRTHVGIRMHVNVHLRICGQSSLGNTVLFMQIWRGETTYRNVCVTFYEIYYASQCKMEIAALRNLHKQEEWSRKKKLSNIHSVVIFQYEPSFIVRQHFDAVCSGLCIFNYFDDCAFAGWSWEHQNESLLNYCLGFKNSNIFV